MRYLASKINQKLFYSYRADNLSVFCNVLFSIAVFVSFASLFAAFGSSLIGLFLFLPHHVILMLMDMTLISIFVSLIATASWILISEVDYRKG